MPNERSGGATSVAIVVAAHGSRAEAANLAHREVVEALAASVDHPVTPAFLELAEPSIPTAIDAAAATGVDAVLVLPYFLHPGRHLSDDLPAIVAEAHDRFPEVEVRLWARSGPNRSCSTCSWPRCAGARRAGLDAGVVVGRGRRPATRRSCTRG